jgi:hypothetical protein
VAGAEVEAYGFEDEALEADDDPGGSFEDLISSWLATFFLFDEPVWVFMCRWIANSPCRLRQRACLGS